MLMEGKTVAEAESILFSPNSSDRIQSFTLVLILVAAEKRGNALDLRAFGFQRPPIKNQSHASNDRLFALIVSASFLFSGWGQIRPRSLNKQWKQKEKEMKSV